MLFHYRDRDKLEVDFALENSAGEIVGIEVKSAAALVTRRDFLGLERVASAAGSAFMQGIVLHDGVHKRSVLVYIWIEDRATSLNVDLVRAGIYPGAAMGDLLDSTISPK